MLENNINTYNIKNVKLINDSIINHIKHNKYNIYFFDPPWGGVNYKHKKRINLHIDNIPLINIIKMLKSDNILIFKLPFNYNFNEFIDIDYKVISIKNYFIVII